MKKVEFFLKIFLDLGFGQLVLKFRTKIPRGSKQPCKLNDKSYSAINGRGMKNWRLSTNILLYFENDIRYGYSYN